jgi:hypothetical protein
MDPSDLNTAVYALQMHSTAWSRAAQLPNLEGMKSKKLPRLRIANSGGPAESRC